MPDKIHDLKFSCQFQGHMNPWLVKSSKSADPGFRCLSKRPMLNTPCYQHLNTGVLMAKQTMEQLLKCCELNTVVQKQVSAALKQMSNGNNKKSSDSQKSNDVTKITNKMTSQRNPMSHVYPSKPGKPNHQILVKQKSKKWVARLGIGVSIVVLGACHMEPKIIRIQQPCHKQHHPHLPPPSQTWSNMDFRFLGMSCSSMNSFLAGFLCGFSAYFPH